MSSAGAAPSCPLIGAYLGFFVGEPERRLPTLIQMTCIRDAKSFNETSTAIGVDTGLAILVPAERDPTKKF